MTYFVFLSSNFFRTYIKKRTNYKSFFFLNLLSKIYWVKDFSLPRAFGEFEDRKRKRQLRDAATRRSSRRRRPQRSNWSLINRLH